MKYVFVFYLIAMSIQTCALAESGQQGGPSPSPSPIQTGTQGANGNKQDPPNPAKQNRFPEKKVLYAFAAAFVAGIVAVFNQLQNILMQRSNLTVQVMMKCIEKYHNIEDLEQKDKRYFDKLWNLHFEQYCYFKQGFLPADLYANWLSHRSDHYHGKFRESEKAKTSEIPTNTEAAQTEQSKAGENPTGTDEISQWERVSENEIADAKFTGFINGMVVARLSPEQILKAVKRASRFRYWGFCLVMVALALMTLGACLIAEEWAPNSEPPQESRQNP